SKEAVLSMTIAIRKATPDDVKEITSLIDTSVRALSVGYYSDVEIELSLASVFGVDSQLIADGTMYVAVDDNAILGCGGWSKRRTLYGGDQFTDRSDAELNPSTDPARIRAFFVDPSHVRRGIGTRILHKCETAARQAGFTRAELGATL